MKKISIGIIAHVDSGKTTLSEAILHKSGIIRSLGRVDKGSSYLDTNSIEKDRGITIFSSEATFVYNGIEFCLIDTPGHVDFSPETERAMRVIDCAVLVINGADGVQSHSTTLWKLLESYKIPTFIFINKMDITALDSRQIMEELKYKLGDGCINFTVDTDIGEELAMCDEAIMESFLSGKAIRDEQIADAVAERRIFPCSFGSAINEKGVDRLLDLLSSYASAPKYKEEFGARVFKITQDKNDKIVHIKLTGGKLKVKDTLSGTLPNGKTWSDKVNQLRIYSGEKYKTENEVTAGTVCAVTGLASAYLGEGLGFEKDAGATYLEPVLSYKLALPGGTDIHQTLSLLKKLEEEEPSLRIMYDERQGEISVGIMGDVQIEVLTRIIKERFSIDVKFEEGNISYKETVKSAVVGVGHYEPLRHYAEVQLLIEPLARGEGLKFSVDRDCPLEGNFRNLVLSHLFEKKHIGTLIGAPVTDMKVTLIAGRSHPKHTEGGDFRQATFRALRQGLRKAEMVLLEPWYDFRIELPSDYVGRAMTDIAQMKGTLKEPEITPTLTVLSGSAPVSKMRGYHRELISYTKGTGKIYTTPGGYFECVNSEEVISNSGYNPDSDIENTADSIFCAGGAGFVVKWNEVDEYKHTESGVELEAPPVDEITERGNRYIRTVADNAELMRIFEMTYGPLKKRNYNEPKGKSAVPTPKKKSHTAPIKSYSGSEYLLIDGYNIIYAWEELRALSEKSLDIARNKLIDRICNYRGFKNCNVILVFDAYKVPHNGETEEIGGITVVYTKEAETADTYIERVSHELSKNHRVRVATSDLQEQLIILGNGAIRLSAEGLRAEVTEVERQIREFIGER